REPPRDRVNLRVPGADVHDVEIVVGGIVDRIAEADVARLLTALLARRVGLAGRRGCVGRWLSRAARRRGPAGARDHARAQQRAPLEPFTAGNLFAHDSSFIWAATRAAPTGGPIGVRPYDPMRCSFKKFEWPFSVTGMLPTNTTRSSFCTRRRDKVICSALATIASADVT